jgi:hypothetical protein
MNGEGLFDQNVQSGFECFDADRCVRVVRRRDENGIDFAGSDQFGAKKISACWRILAEEFLVRVADGRQSAAGYGARRDCMCVNLAHIPEADDTQPKILH